MNSIHGNHGDTLFFDKIDPQSSQLPTVVFLPGYRSDRLGSKAISLEQHAAARGWGFVRFDYHAHGDSPGDFLEGTIGRWINNSLDIIDQVTHGPLILVGSSMGGWIMLHAALARRARVRGLLGIAAAPDFTHDLMIPRFSANERQQLADKGFIAQPTPYDDAPYLISQTLLDDGNRRLLLNGTIDFEGPVSLVHGLLDQDVPLSSAQKLVGALASQDVQLIQIKDGEHRLSRDSDLAAIANTLTQLVQRAGL